VRLFAKEVKEKLGNIGKFWHQFYGNFLGPLWAYMAQFAAALGIAWVIVVVLGILVAAKTKRRPMWIFLLLMALIWALGITVNFGTLHLGK